MEAALSQIEGYAVCLILELSANKSMLICVLFKSMFDPSYALGTIVVRW
jgi:hypothetical protein